MVVRCLRSKSKVATDKISGARSSTKTVEGMTAVQKTDVNGLPAGLNLKESDNRFTSLQLIAPIENSFGEIDFDPCWHASSAVRPKAYFDVRRGDDGLRDEWSGGVVLVNPPWSAQDRWVRRAHDQWLRGNVDTVVCIVPAKTDARVFHETLVEDADVYFLGGRPRFFQENGKSEPTMVSVMIVMFGASSVQKARFAALVKGLWLRPGRPSLPRAGQVRATPLGVGGSYRSASCVAPDDDGRRTVLCAPFAGMTRPASLVAASRA